MKGTRKFKKAGIEYEELKVLNFQNMRTGKHYRVHLVEPVNQGDLEKYGTLLLEAEIKKEEDVEIIGDLVEHKLDNASPAIQGFICDYRRQIIYHLNREPSVEEMLKDLVEVGIAHPLRDLPVGIEGFRIKTKPEWKLFGINSEIEFPYGETIRATDGTEFELVGGTPPHKPASAGFVRVIDSDGEKRELYPHVFKLEWRKVAK